MDDPCWKVLPRALKKYSIDKPAEHYSLALVYNVGGVEDERSLEANELPLHVFYELEMKGRKPEFILRQIVGFGKTPGLPPREESGPQGELALVLQEDEVFAETVEEEAVNAHQILELQKPHNDNIKEEEICTRNGAGIPSRVAAISLNNPLGQRVYLKMGNNELCQGFLPRAVTLAGLGLPTEYYELVVQHKLVEERIVGARERPWNIFDRLEREGRAPT